jgi:aminoglycoside 3-N-acetyltransferase
LRSSVSGEAAAVSLLETLSGFAVRHLPRERVLTLRERYHGMRKRLYPLLRRLHGTFGADELRRNLEAHVGHDYEILMVHSSLNHMLPMYTGDAVELMRMLIAFCGAERTMAMPAFFLGDPRTNDVVSHYRQTPLFDVRRTPSQMGIVTELFRRSPGVRLSLHPTHRIAALGPLADELTRGHDAAGSTFGAGTPFEFMARHDTCVVGIGKPIEVLSQVHHVEDLLGDRFPVPGKVDTVRMTLRDAQNVERPFELRWRSFERPRDMWKLRGIVKPGTLHEWTFHHVPMFSARASEVTVALTEAARRNVTVYVDP